MAVIGRAAPHGMEPLAPESALLKQLKETGRGAVVKARHKLGHEMQMMARSCCGQGNFEHCAQVRAVVKLATCSCRIAPDWC